MSTRPVTAPLTSYPPGTASDAAGERATLPALVGPVLLASDGNAATDAAPLTARSLAERAGVPVEVVTALQPLPIHTLGYDTPAFAPDLETERRDELESRVRRRLEPLLGAPSRWPLDLRYGDPGRVIARAAQERGASLIVVGTGSHRLVDRLLGGETSLQVVRHASAPVLAVAPLQLGPIRRAVVGVDFSAASIRAARTALALLEPDTDHTAAPGAAPDAAGLLTLVHVRSILTTTPPGLAAWMADYESDVARRFERLVALLRPFAPAGVTIETRLAAGEIVEELEHVARHIGADLLAVGTHGPDWVERLFVGSIATTALRQARRTVLVAPAPPPAERVRLELRVQGEVTLEHPADWGGALDVLTRRNLARRVRLEVSGPEVPGFVVEADRYRFRGATYDPHDRRVQIMLGDDADRSCHLTHAMGQVRSVGIVGADERRDRALVVDVDDGSAVLTFVD